jgi:hypothetical protein
MSTRASQSHERFRAALRGQSPTPVAGVGGVVPPASERTRFIATMSAEQHRYLRLLALDHRLDGSALIRAMIATVEADPAVRARVLEAARLHSW